MELLTPMPPIHFKPIESKKKQAKGNYTCPLYYYSIRTGTRYFLFYLRIILKLKFEIIIFIIFNLYIHDTERDHRL